MSRYRIALSLLVAVVAALTLPNAARAQNAATLKLGDPAPALKVEKFIKGEPVTEFKPGHVYVVEFWATWCGPCKMTMPHLTELQKKFQGKATFIGVNIWEPRQSPYTAQTLTKVEEFVKKNADKMGYTVAYDGGAREMAKAYMEASGQGGIPCAFVVSTDAKIAYIGDPRAEEFESTIQKLIDGKFDMNATIAETKERQAKQEEEEKNYRLFMAKMNEAQTLLGNDKIDEGLAKIDEAAKLVPDVDPAQVEMQKFAILMNLKKYEPAYKIATKLVEGPAKDNAMYLNGIAWSIVDPEANIEKPNIELALKAAELAVKTEDGKDPAVLDTLARCYWLKGEKTKAIEVQTKAVELSKDDPEMKESLQKTLDEYKK